MASDGYPVKYERGYEIEIPDDIDGDVFVAGAALRDGRLVTDGGRVLGVTARGKTLPEAVRHAYENVGRIKFENSYIRQDIGRRAIAAISEEC